MNETKKQTSGKNKVAPERVRNPKTGRWITVGGRVYRGLQAENILNLETTEPNKVIFEGKNCKSVKKKLKNITLPKGKKLVIHNNTVMTRNRTISRTEIAEKTKNLAIQIFKNSPERFKGLSPAECSDLVQKMINQMMIDPNNNYVKTQMKYIIANISDDVSEYESGSEYEYYSDDEEVEVEIEEPKREVDKEGLKTIIEEVCDLKIDDEEEKKS